MMISGWFFTFLEQDQICKRGGGGGGVGGGGNVEKLFSYNILASYLPFVLGYKHA